jgi:hypothetical protein
VNYSRTVSLVIAILKEMIDKFPAEMQNRGGGYLTVWCFGDDAPMISEEINLGLCDISAKLEAYKFNSLEKAKRLIEMVDRPEHVSSWQSRDFDNKKYGGAIAGYDAVFSFSGLPEKLDEYLMVVLAWQLGNIDQNRIEEIARISDNEFIDQFDYGFI